MTTNDFNILEWIETGTVGRREVTIYADKALIAEMERLDRELADARKADEDPERTVSDAPRVAEIEAEMEAVYERWEASKSVWTIQSLTDEAVEEVFAEIPDPEIPPRPQEPKETPNPGKAAERRREYEAAMEAFRPLAAKFKKDRDAAIAERELRLVAAAVVQVTTAKGSTSSVSVDALRALRKSPATEHGYKRLVQTMNDLKAHEVEVPSPHRD